MTNQRKQPNASNDMHAHLSLLETLVLAENAYPWNPADLDAETYLENLDQTFHIDSELAEDIENQSETFYAHLEQLWPVSPSPSLFQTLQATLHQQFAAAAVPCRWLDTIAQQAASIKLDHLSIADQLVECVKPLLPNWEIEDLQVLARPLAHAFRGNEATAERLGTDAPSGIWSQLSELDQVRLSMAIARHVLTQRNQMNQQVSTNSFNSLSQSNH